MTPTRCRSSDESDSDIEMEEGTDSTSDSCPEQQMFTDDDLSSVDDDMIMDGDSAHDARTRKVQQQIEYDRYFGFEEPRPMGNILMFHPAFNKTREFHDALNQYKSVFAGTSDELMVVKTPTVDVPIKDPLNPSKVITIRAAADTGSEIQCVGPRLFKYYKAKGVTKHSRIGQGVNTGNGRIVCHEYIPIYLETNSGRFLCIKFWHLKSHSII